MKTKKKEGLQIQIERNFFIQKQNNKQSKKEKKIAKHKHQSETLFFFFSFLVLQFFVFDLPQF